MDLIGLAQKRDGAGRGGGLSEDGNEVSVSMRCGDFS